MWLVVVTGCDQPVITSLEEAGSLRVDLTARPVEGSDGAQDLWVRVQPSSQDCLVLDDAFTGALAGQAPRELDRGAYDPDLGCTEPSLHFRIEPAAARAARLIVQDASRTVPVELGDRLARRELSFADVDAPVSVGRAVALRWSHLDDHARGELSARVRRGEQVADATLDLTDGRLRVTIPVALAGEPAPTGKLCIDWRADAALDCGLDRCTIDARQTVCVPVGFAP